MIAQGRIRPDEETVLCITGNGLKTTDALVNRYTLEAPIEPRLAAFEKFMGQAMAVSAVVVAVPWQASGAFRLPLSFPPQPQILGALSTAPESR